MVSLETALKLLAIGDDDRVMLLRMRTRDEIITGRDLKSKNKYKNAKVFRIMAWFLNGDFHGYQLSIDQ